VNIILLDTGRAGGYGGTGKTFDWSLAVKYAQLTRIILAGGLTADNVAEAITTVRPTAIDVCSGVEAEPGRKDLVKLRDFMLAAAKANALLVHSRNSGRVE